MDQANQWTRGNKDMAVALKCLDDSKDITLKFLNEVIVLMICLKKPSNYLIQNLFVS